MKIHLPLSIRRCLLACITSTAGVCICGTSAMAESQNLTFSGSDLTWNTLAENAAFVTGDGASAPFTQGDNVSFTNKATVSLEENISAGTIKIESEADVIILQNNYTLEAERIELAGTLDAGGPLHIDNGTTLAVVSAPAVLNSNLVLGNGGTLASGAAANLNGNTLALYGGSELQLTATGDGKTYTLFTGISGLKDAQGNTIALDSTNNAISNYFDINQPGTGFWAEATLVYANGELQLVRHNETVKKAETITTGQTDGVNYEYYAGVTFENIASSSYSGAIYGASITLSHNGSVTFKGNTAGYLGSTILGAFGGTISLSNNGSVIFNGNTVSGRDSHGAAISGSAISLNNNGSVTFSGNMVSSRSSSYAHSACGGAIYGNSDGSIKLSNNGYVIFSGNTAICTPSSAHSQANGGAIYGDFGSTITLSNNGCVKFIGNSASNSSTSTSGNEFAVGGAICGKGDIMLNGNGSVEFISNTAISSAAFSDSNGGAILGWCDITLSDNDSVTFSGNTASAYGGAIYGYGNITMSDNDSVTFSGNTAESCGGAIYGNITMNDNGCVTFSNNTAIDSDSSSSHAYGGAINGNITMNDNGCVTFSNNTAIGSDAYGGAIYGNSDASIKLSNNGSVTFSSNTAYYGGAIYGNITMSNNGSMIFSGNTAYSGGAIRGHGVIMLSDNSTVTFIGNTAESRGGAIYGGSCTITMSNNDTVTISESTASSGGAIYGNITMTNNGSMIFSGNTASAYGGAIYGNITLNDNGCVTFSNNTARSSGGAIYGGDCTITMSNNDTVSFSCNTAYSGGAIYGGDCTITMSNNDTVSFSCNTTYFGGAIESKGGLYIRNNDSVLFERNAEVSSSGTYHLCSIHAFGIGTVISLSVAAGKSIVFRDSVDIDSGTTVNLNADYGEIKQKGDIIFTGATTEADLQAVKGSTGTATEILNSRTSEVYTMTNLYGGRLRVEDGAVYKGNGITAHVDSAATVRVKDAELSHVGYELEFNAGTALEVAGNSTIRGNVKLLEQSTFKLEQAATLSLHETVEADVAALTVNGTALLEGNSTLNASLTLADGATLDMDVLDAGAVTLNGALTFAGKVCMGTKLQDILSEMQGWEESITLFTGLTNLVLPGTVSEDATGRVWVGDVFSNMEGHTQYYFNYSPDVGSLAVVYIPEPATSTLSLLALTALATRRKRK